MPLNLILGLHTLLDSPRPGITSFAIIQIMLPKTSGTTQRISIIQLLPCEVE